MNLHDGFGRRVVASVVAAAALAIVAGGCGAHGGTKGSSSEPDPERRGPQGRVAQFVVHCDFSHAEYDDPIVYPDQPGMSHLHTFFGNRMVDSDPDYERVAGAETSCEQPGDTASYWAPALLDATGEVVEPEGITAYYRPGFGVDPALIEPYPAGLMLVAGDKTSTEPQSSDIVAWSCGTSAARESEPMQCPADETLRVMVNFPDCWDGEHLGPEAADSSADEPSATDASVPDEPAAHDAMSHPEGADVTAFTTYSESGTCPASHPVPIPMLQLAIDYPPVDPTDLSLASGSIYSAHADFWNVWNQAKLEQEVELCLNADQVCGVSS